MSLGKSLPMIPIDVEFFGRVHFGAKVLYGGAETERSTQEWRYCLGFGEHVGYAARHRPELATVYNVMDHEEDKRPGYKPEGTEIRLVWDYVLGEWVTKAELARLYQCSVKEVTTYDQFEKMVAAEWKIEKAHLAAYSRRTRAFTVVEFSSWHFATYRAWEYSDDYFQDTPTIRGGPKKQRDTWVPFMTQAQIKLNETNLLNDLRSIDIAMGRDPAAGYFAGLSKKPEGKGKGKAREVIDVDAPPIVSTQHQEPRKRMFEETAALPTIEEGNEEDAGGSPQKKKARLDDEEIEAVAPLPVASAATTTKKTRSRVASKTPAAAPSTRVTRSKSRVASVAPPVAPVAAAVDAVAGPVVLPAPSAPSATSTAATTAAPLGRTRSMSRKASQAPSVVPSAPSVSSARPAAPAPSTSKGRKRKAEASVDGPSEEADAKIVEPPAKKARQVAKKEKEPEVETFARRSTRAKSTTAKAAGLQKNGKWSSAGLKGPMPK